MTLKDYYNIETDMWQEEETMSILKEQKPWMNEDLYSLLNNEYPYMHGCGLISFEYVNPHSNGKFGPYIVIELQTDLEKRICLIFSQVYDIQLAGSFKLNTYVSYMEEVDKILIQMKNGYVEMVSKFTSGLSLYIMATGVDFQKIE